MCVMGLGFCGVAGEGRGSIWGGRGVIKQVNVTVNSSGSPDHSYACGPKLSSVATVVLV